MSRCNLNGERLTLGSVGYCLTKVDDLELRVHDGVMDVKECQQRSQLEDTSLWKAVSLKYMAET